jgi:hypothetical protein
MSRLTEQQIQKMTDTMRQEQGANAEEIHELLERALTVGDLKKILAHFDDSLPVELEVIIDVTENGDCAAQPGLAIHHYEVTEEDDGFPRLTLVGAPPQMAQAYAEAFELDSVQQ